MTSIFSACVCLCLCLCLCVYVCVCAFVQMCMPVSVCGWWGGGGLQAVLMILIYQHGAEKRCAPELLCSAALY